MADLISKKYINKKKYFITPIGKVTKESIKNLIQTGALRKNNDGTKAILKHSKDSVKPVVFALSNTMTHTEALKVRNKPEWTSEDVAHG